MTKDDRETLRQLEGEEREAEAAWKSFDLETVLYGGNEVERVRLRVNAATEAYEAALRTHATDLIHAHETLERVRELTERIVELRPTKYGYGEQTQKIERGELLAELLAILRREGRG